MIKKEDKLPLILDKIKTKSSGFKNPVLIKKEEIVSVFSNNDIISIFKGFAKIKDYKSFPIRVFVNDNTENYYFRDIIHKNPPQKNENILDWINKIFQKNKFCIIINTCECISEDVSIKVANFFKPLYEKFGFPYFKMKTNLIVGNYDYTPLGIHIDYPNQRVVHFQLGNAKKMMYVWDNNKLNKLTGSNFNNYRDVENFNKYKAIANKYCIEEGDLFLLPSGQYHLGEVLNNDISISLNVALHRQTKFNILNSVLNIYKNDIVKEIEDIDAYSFDPDKFDLDIVNSKLLNESLSHYSHFLESSLGFESTPSLKKKMPNIKKLENIYNISIVSPYKLIIKKSDKEFILYLRGRTIKIPKIKSILHVSKMLNKNIKIDIEIILDIMNKDLNEEEIYYLITLLYQYGIIYINK